MTVKELSKTHVSLPVWLASIIIMIFLSLIGYIANGIDQRFDRIEHLLITHITNNDIKR